MPIIAVVIPFYQVEPGILLGAIESVFRQRVPSGTTVDIIVVDDASPVKGRDEIGNLVPPPGFNLTLIEQVNGGPGAARNTALNNLPEQTEFVAFLDSDDRWNEDHLSAALSVLADDADFYFCDHSRWYDQATWFESSNTIRKWRADGDKRMVADRADSTILSLNQNDAFCSFIEDYLAHTSSVVYRFSRCRDVRFDTRLRHAGEDTMFWLELAQTARAVRFSTVPRVHTGRGNNMYFASIEWDHPEAARRIGYILILFARIHRKFKLTGPAQQAAGERLRALQKTFGHVWLRKLVKFRDPDWRALYPVVREDPWVLPRMLFIGAEMARRHLLKGQPSEK